MFWDNFKQMCDERGVRPTPVLKECGISTGSISRWKGGASPYADAVLTIAEYLHCSTDVLLRGHEYYKSAPEVSSSELELLRMYRYLPESQQDFISGSIRAAYEKEIQRQEAASKSSDLAG